MEEEKVGPGEAMSSAFGHSQRTRQLNSPSRFLGLPPKGDFFS